MYTNPVVILTRESRDNHSLSQQLETHGFRVMEYPCIKTRLKPYQKGQPIAGFELQDFSVVIFTSRRGVMGMNNVFDQLAGTKLYLAVVGSSTASAVRQLIGRSPDLVADPPTGDVLAHQLVTRLESKVRILHVRGNKTSGTLKDTLEHHGYPVNELIVYHNEMPVLEPLPAGIEGIVIIASPSAAAGFLKYNSSIDGHLDFLAIGPVTASFLKGKGIKRVFQASSPEQNSLLSEVKNILGHQNKHNIKTND